MRHVLLPATQRVKRPSIVIDDIRPLIKLEADRTQARWNNPYGYYRSKADEERVFVPVNLTDDMKKAKSLTVSFGYSNVPAYATAANYLRITLSDNSTALLGIDDTTNGTSYSTTVYNGVGGEVVTTQPIERTLIYTVPLGKTIKALDLMSGFGQRQETNRGMRNFIFGF